MFLGDPLQRRPAIKRNPGTRDDTQELERGKRLMVGETIHVARGVNNVRNRRSYYGFAMKFEPIDNRQGTEVTFECVEARWFNAHQGDATRAFWKSFWAQPVLPAVRVTLRTGPGIAYVGNGIRFDATLNNIALSPRHPVPSVQENQWYKLSLIPGQGPPLVEVEQMLDADDFAPPVDVTLWRVSQVDFSVRADLHRIYYIHPSKTQSLVAQVNPEVSFVGVLNVGQGGCNAIYGADGHPFVYFDFGRSKGRDSRPTAMRPCLANSPTIILSHWDQDHFEMAASYPEAKHVPWICLPGPTGSNTGPFFRSLTHVRVRAEDDEKFEEYPWGFILKATDPNNANSKNDAGLAALIRVQDDSNAPPPGQRRALDPEGSRPQIFPDERYVLLTGDAMCQHIPSCFHHDLDGRIIGISAIHHGSDVGMVGNEASIPLASGPLHNLPPTVVYTYGINRSTGNSAGGYGHPHAHAVETYIRRGYHHRIETNTFNAGGAPWVHSRSCVLGWKRLGMAPVDGAAAAINVARNAYNNLVAIIPALLLFAQQAKAQSAITAAVPLASGATIVTAVQLLASYAPVQADADVATLILNANVALAPAANALFDAFPGETLTRVNNVAAALAQAVAANDPDFPDNQDVRCQGGFGGVAIAVPPCLACTPGPAPTSAACAHPNPPVLTNTNCTAVETAGHTVITVPGGHGLPNGANVTADIYVNAATVHLNDEQVQINQTTGVAFRRNCTLTYHAPTAQRVNCTITDQGAPITIVNHDAHYLDRRTQVNLANASAHGGLLHGNHWASEINAESYSIDNVLALPGLAGITADATGDRAPRDYRTAVTITDDGAGNVTVTENGHFVGPVATVKKIDLQQATNMVHRGNSFWVTVVDANTYTFTVPAMHAVAINNDPAEAKYHTAPVRFNNERVFISSSQPVSIVRYNHHGLSDDHVATITLAANAAYNATHTIVKNTDHEFIIPVGDGLGTVDHGTVDVEPNGCRNYPALIEDTGNHIVVTHNAHGFPTGSFVRLTVSPFAGLAYQAYTGFHQIQKIDANSYRIDQFVNAGNAVFGVQIVGIQGAMFYGGEPITLSGNMGNALLTVIHNNHGLTTGETVTIASAAINGAPVITVTGPNTYTVPLGAPLVANLLPVVGTAEGSRAHTGAEPNVGTAHNSAVLVRQSVLMGIKEGIEKLRRAQAADAAVARWQARTGNASCTANACEFRGLARRL